MLTTKTSQTPRRASAEDMARFEAKLAGDAALQKARELAAQKAAAKKAAEMVGSAVLQKAQKFAAARKKNTQKKQKP